MHFFNIALASAIFTNVALSMTIRPRAMTSDDVVANIKQITTLSQNLQTVALSIPQEPILFDPTIYQPLIKGFTGIITLVTADINAMQSSPMAPFTDPAAGQPICDAFRDFVAVHQALLAIVIGKSGLLQSLGGGPVAEVLRSLERVVDAIAYGIIDLVPTCAQGAANDLDNLDGTIKQAICAYTPLGALGLDLFC